MSDITSTHYRRQKPLLVISSIQTKANCELILPFSSQNSFGLPVLFIVFDFWSPNKVMQGAFTRQVRRGEGGVGVSCFSNINAVFRRPNGKAPS